MDKKDRVSVEFRTEHLGQRKRTGKGRNPMNKQKINPDGTMKPPASYTNVVKISDAKDLIFLSGVSATDENGRIVGKGDILEQTRQIAMNIITLLKAAGAGAENVTMTTTYVLSEHMDAFLQTGVANELFSALDNPADTLVGVASLAGMKYGAMIEVSVVAAV